MHHAKVNGEPALFDNGRGLYAFLPKNEYGFKFLETQQGEIDLVIDLRTGKPVALNWIQPSESSDIEVDFKTRHSALAPRLH